MFADNGADEMLLRFHSREVHPSIQAWATRIHHVEDARAHLVGDPALLAFYGERVEELHTIAEAGMKNHPELRAAVFGTSAYGTGRVVIQQRGITKGSGVLELCRHYAIEPRNCMVFGDWHNDLSMFGVGCTNVAMANAVPELRARADYLTERDNESDGVAHFLERAFL
jgi:hydroxymethylpyrimidine pyrophosphatase-like HAD family hydrolase